jgi:putative transposase
MTLHALKKNGHKVGRLKFKKEVNSIPLKEHGNTYYTDIPHSCISTASFCYWRFLGLESYRMDG